MPEAVRLDQIVHLKVRSADDPERNRSAALMAAYVHAEQVRSFRRLLFPRLALAALVWIIVVPRMLTTTALWVGVALISSVAVAAAIAEWRADHQLSEALADGHPRL